MSSHGRTIGGLISSSGEHTMEIVEWDSRISAPPAVGDKFYLCAVGYVYSVELVKKVDDRWYHVTFTIVPEFEPLHQQKVKRFVAMTR